MKSFKSDKNYREQLTILGLMNFSQSIFRHLKEQEIEIN